MTEPRPVLFAAATSLCSISERAAEAPAQDLARAVDVRRPPRNRTDQQPRRTRPPQRRHLPQAQRRQPIRQRRAPHRTTSLRAHHLPPAAPQPARLPHRRPQRPRRRRPRATPRLTAPRHRTFTRKHRFAGTSHARRGTRTPDTWIMIPRRLGSGAGFGGLGDRKGTGRRSACSLQPRIHTLY
jgi:hypothetical protein